MQKKDSPSSSAFPSEDLFCPPHGDRGPLQTIPGEDVKGWEIASTDDGKGHDIHIWCVEPAPYHFAVQLSHPDRSRTWFGLCLFNDGINYVHFDGFPWQVARWHNFDPKGAKADYKTFDDIHYQYAWSSGALTIQLTKGGNAATGAIGDPVGSPLIVDARALDSDEAFEKAVHDVIASQPGGEDVHQGSGCEVRPR